MHEAASGSVASATDSSVDVSRAGKSYKMGGNNGNGVGKTWAAEPRPFPLFAMRASPDDVEAAAPQLEDPAGGGSRIQIRNQPLQQQDARRPLDVGD